MNHPVFEMEKHQQVERGIKEFQLVGATSAGDLGASVAEDLSVAPRMP